MLQLRLVSRSTSLLREASRLAPRMLPALVQTTRQPNALVFQSTTSLHRRCCSNEATTEMSESAYHDLADAWIGSLEESLEALDDVLDDFDISNAQGVLNLQLGEHGTYVLNKQAPNREIWWSSPVSGPKRFAWDATTEEWRGTRDGAELLSLLSKELQELLPGFSLNVPEVRQEALDRMAAM